MALYHFSVKQVFRGKGQTVVNSAAYISGQKLYNDYYGQTHDYTKKSGVVFTEILTPEYVPERLTDRETLWNEVEKIEKGKRAQLAYSFDIALQNELLFYHLSAQPVGSADVQTEQLAVQSLHLTAHGAMAVGLFADAGAVLGFLARPGLAAQHGGDRLFPHTAGQVVGQLLRHLAAFVGNGVAVAGQGDQLLLCDIVQTGADLKIIDKGFLHQGVLNLLPGNGTGVFHQIAQ